MATEQFYFERDGWIQCRTRQERIDRGEPCWQLSRPQTLDSIYFLDPELPDFLNEIVEQIGPLGEYRAQAEAILNSVGLTGVDLDASLAEGRVRWSTGMGWANVLQARMGDYMFYVAFHAEHEGETHVPVDAAIIRDPNAEGEPGQPITPTQDAAPNGWLFVDSPQAREFISQGQFAHCAQQALLDAGFDPNGVDGAPGGGARQALAAWSEAAGITMPEFTQGTASQICHALTAAQAFHADLPVGLMVGYPGAAWQGWTSNSGGLHDFAGINVTVRYDGDIVRQVAALDFGPGIIYRFDGQDGNGNTVNEELQPPWPIIGTVMTPGTDEPRPLELFNLMQNDNVGAAQAVVDGQAGGYRGLLDDLYNRPHEIDARWSVIGNLNGADVVVLDAVPSRNDAATGRVVVIFSDDGRGGGQLLYAWHQRRIPGQVEIQPISQ